MSVFHVTMQDVCNEFLVVTAAAWALLLSSELTRESLSCMLDGALQCMHVSPVPPLLQDVLKRQVPPGAILLELHPDALDSNGYQGGAVALLQELYNLGYTDISHSGYVGARSLVIVTCSRLLMRLSDAQSMSLHCSWCHAAACFWSRNAARARV